MKQIARNLTDADEGFLNGARYLTHDRDPLVTEAFRELLEPYMDAAVGCRERLGGVLNYYDRRAA
jgi:hypothetical protein